MKMLSVLCALLCTPLPAWAGEVQLTNLCPRPASVLLLTNPQGTGSQISGPYNLEPDQSSRLRLARPKTPDEIPQAISHRPGYALYMYAADAQTHQPLFPGSHPVVVAGVIYPMWRVDYLLLPNGEQTVSVVLSCD